MDTKGKLEALEEKMTDARLRKDEILAQITAFEAEAKKYMSSRADEVALDPHAIGGNDDAGIVAEGKLVILRKALENVREEIASYEVEENEVKLAAKREDVEKHKAAYEKARRKFSTSFSKTVSASSDLLEAAETYNIGLSSLAALGEAGKLNDAKRMRDWRTRFGKEFRQAETLLKQYG